MSGKEIEPVAFLSYAHLDDAGAAKEISNFHDCMQTELRIQTGKNVHIFFDRKSISWGKRWSDFISHGIGKSAFLIPIITPAYLNSKSCKEEYIQFEEVERRIGRKDLVLPIYYVKCHAIEHQKDRDPFIDRLFSRQYRDWRKLRHKPFDSPDIMSEFSDLTSAMAETLAELGDMLALDNNKRSEKISETRASNDSIDEILSRPITLDNLVIYQTVKYPGLPVSLYWTTETLNDINSLRYKTIYDIEKIINLSSRKINEYAALRPELFRYATDYMTKSLTFVDAEFRSRHSNSPETIAAALQANISL